MSMKNVPHKGLNDLINLTPTGEKRARLTIINMILLAIDNNLSTVDKLIDCVNILEPKCPVDHSELSYGEECPKCHDRVEIKDCGDNRCLCGGKFPNNHLQGCPLAPHLSNNIQHHKEVIGGWEDKVVKPMCSCACLPHHRDCPVIDDAIRRMLMAANNSYDRGIEDKVAEKQRDERISKLFEAREKLKQS